MNEKIYGIDYINKRHCYFLDLNSREFALDHTSPVRLEIETYRIDESSWSRLLEKVSNYLIEKYPKPKDEYLDIQFSWSKQYVFTQTKTSSTSFGPLKNGIFVNTNHTSTHLLWLIQDLLLLFGEKLDLCKLWIRKPPGIETDEVVKHYHLKAKIELKEYLASRLKYDEDKATKILSGIDKIDQLFIKFSPMQKSLLLFESKTEYSALKSKFKRKLQNEIKNESHLIIIEQILNVLTLYYGSFYKA
jgi:hypothetical protein